MRTRILSSGLSVVLLGPGRVGGVQDSEPEPTSDSGAVPEGLPELDFNVQVQTAVPDLSAGTIEATRTGSMRCNLCPSPTSAPSARASAKRPLREDFSNTSRMPSSCG